MSGCLICAEKEELLKQAVMEHWRGVRRYQAALEALEDLSVVERTMRATRTEMNQAEDSYRQHLRLMHESGVGIKTPAVSTFTRFYTRRQGLSEVVCN
jgi:hypothetical protein